MSHTPGPWFVFGNGHCVGGPRTDPHPGNETAGIAMCNMRLRDETENEELRRLRWFGISRDWLVGPLGEREYELEADAMPGGKHHMNDIAAAVGLGNLTQFDQWQARRKEIALQYLERLAGCVSFPPPLAPGNESSWWLFPVLVERRDDFVRALRSRGVEASVVHRRIDRHPLFGGLRDLPGAVAFDARQANLPCHPGLSDDDVDAVVAAVKAGW